MNNKLLLNLHEAGNVTLSNAIVKALQKNIGLEYRSICEKCGFVLARYAGSYPKKCPICQTPFVKLGESLVIESETGKELGIIIIEECMIVGEAKIDNFEDLKAVILKKVDITGKDDKTDPDELEAMADIRDNVHDYKSLIKTLKKDYHFDKKLLKDIDDVVIDFQFS